eukprot:jgi/Psemu1/326921/estExt_fgenesh1_pg.C_4970009
MDCARSASASASNSYSYSTIGIECFLRGNGNGPPCDTPFDSDGTQFQSVSWEIVGTIKERPEDFVVREILPGGDDSQMAVIAIAAAAADAGVTSDRLRVASLDSTPRAIELPSADSRSPVEDRESRPFPEGEVPPSFPTSTSTPISTPVSGDGSSGATMGGAGCKPPPEETKAEAEASKETKTETVEAILPIPSYLEMVATADHPAATLLERVEELNASGILRVPVGDHSGNHNGLETTTATTTTTTTMTMVDQPAIGENNHNGEVWIPPLLPTDSDATMKDGDHETATTTTEAETEMRARRKDFHRAIRLEYPFLKTESAIRPRSRSNSSEDPGSSQPATSDGSGGGGGGGGERKHTEEHWIKIRIEDCFDELIPYLHAPRDDLTELLLFRNRGFGETTDCANGAANYASATLRLRPGLSKDDRRKVHHILASKNKHFETSIRNHNHNHNQGSSSSKSKSKSRSRSNSKSNSKPGKPPPTTESKPGEEDGKTRHNDNTADAVPTATTNLVTNKEHLTAIQILTKKLRCRQADIGFAGIKDMQAVTYQFVTLRNATRQRVERAIRNQRLGPGQSDIELKILCSNVDFALNIGGLEGNRFEIVHGFVNFYGEQRIGAPGTRDQVGVRAFEIGRAMLRGDFSGAIGLLLEGTRHHESDAVRRVRSAWRDSKGDPSATLKAFRGDNILPRERAVLRGLNRYPDNPLEALRFLSYNMRIFYVNAYQSYVFNKAASRRIQRFGDMVAKGDLYLDRGDINRDNIRVVRGDEVPAVEISQVVLPLPGHSVRYPEHEIGKLYGELLETDGVQFDKKQAPEATAKGSYRKLVVYPRNLVATADGDGDGDSTVCQSMKLSFDLPKGSYATMLLRELMMTTMDRYEYEYHQHF